jgi:predicted transglutaminase-like cysteine proteinase
LIAVRRVLLAAAIIAAWGACVSFASAEVLGPHLETHGPADPPKGFVGFCDTGPWACGTGIAVKKRLRNDFRQVAIEVNSRVNRTIRPETDIVQYGVEERWTLPDTGKGDCEDYALLKKKLLIERGVPAQRLLLAVVFTPKKERHLVLVLRTSDADLVLDNLELRVLDWRKTGYRVVAMQNPGDERDWLLVKPSGQPDPAHNVATTEN